MDDEPVNAPDAPSLWRLRTEVANKTISLSASINDGLTGLHVGGGDYVVVVTLPEGPSTGGGAQARQSIHLTPRRQGYDVIAIGVLDPVTSTAEVKTFEHVSVLHERRFRRPLEITADEYAKLLVNLDRVLGGLHVHVRRVPLIPDQSTGRPKSLLALALLGGLVAAAAVAYAVMRAV